jgi:hypothetical protein
MRVKSRSVPNQHTTISISLRFRCLALCARPTNVPCVQHPVQLSIVKVCKGEPWIELTSARPKPLLQATHWYPPAESVLQPTSLPRAPVGCNMAPERLLDITATPARNCRADARCLETTRPPIITPHHASAPPPALVASVPSAARPHAARVKAGRCALVSHHMPPRCTPTTPRNSSVALALAAAAAVAAAAAQPSPTQEAARHMLSGRSLRCTSKNGSGFSQSKGT